MCSISILTLYRAKERGMIFLHGHLPLVSVPDQHDIYSDLNLGNRQTVCYVTARLSLQLQTDPLGEYMGLGQDCQI